MADLVLPLKRCYFRQIKDGLKPEEFRLQTSEIGMCQQTINLIAIVIAFFATLILAVLGVKGVSVERDGRISLGGSSRPPEDPKERDRWAFRRYWAYKLGLPLGVLGILAGCVLQGWALYLPQCS